MRPSRDRKPDELPEIPLHRQEDLRAEVAETDDLDAGAAAALDMVSEAEFGARHLEGWAGWLIAAIAAAWSIFQLAIAWRLTLNSDVVRAIHLTFAITLVYLCYPMLKRRKLSGALSALSAKRRLPWLDIVLALAAGAAAMYRLIDYQGIADRQGMPLTRDIVVGVALMLLLLEAARRAFGPALSIVAGAFIAYGFLGPYIPGVMGFSGFGLEQLVSTQIMTPAGIYGTPLRVSASTVFLFVLLGAMLEKSGGGRYFVQLAFSLLGRYKGGPAKAAVVASGLTGMVSGSSIANVVTTGTFTIPLMKKCGYPAEKAAAIEVAASTNGQLMPPIMGAAAFIIAEYCSLPYLDVVRAAFVPAVVSYLGLFYITHLEAGKLGLRGLDKADLPQFFTVLLSGLHFLVPLAGLVWMLVEGYSPQRAAFFAIVTLAALVVVHEIVHAVRMKRSVFRATRRAGRVIGGSLVNGAKGMMAVGVACAAAGIIVGIIGLGPGAKLTAIVDTLSGGSIILVLLLTALASLILGMGLPTTATYIVMASLTAPVIVKLAGDAGLAVPLIAAHLFCFFFGILADDTPPVGLAAYAGAAIGKADPIRTGVQGFVYDLRTAILPFMFIFNTDLLLWGIESWWQIGLIFISATAAIFAFAALTQNYLLTRNRLWEAGALLVSAGLVLRPRLPGEILARLDMLGSLGPAAGIVQAPITWYLVGPALLGAVWLIQRRRVALQAA
ncbi:MAG: TRAP transporter permease [Phycisphaerae bacterium]